MRWCVLVNRVEEVYAAQTTWMLAARAAGRGVEVWMTGVAELELDPSGAVMARARRVPVGAAKPEVVRAAPTERIALDGMDALVFRTSPGRDPGRAWAHEGALLLGRLLVERGVAVVSDPEGLSRAASKLYLAAVPAAHRPVTLVTNDRRRIRALVLESEAGVVIKPVVGTRGDGVFRVRREDLSNFNQIVDAVARDGLVMAQAFVPEARDGDVRLVMLQGEPLVIGGRYASVRRRPGGGDFRSNVHAGGSPEATQPTGAQLATAAAVGPQLARDGLFLVGLDLIGDKVVELNVFSPGGLGDAEAHTGRDFTGAVLDRLTDEVGARRASSSGSTSTPEDDRS